MKRFMSLLLTLMIVVRLCPGALAAQIQENTAPETVGEIEEYMAFGDWTSPEEESEEEMLSDPAPELIRSKLVDVSGAETVTVMVYMIASDLEADKGLAWKDLREMMAARYGEHVQVLVQTMGCKRWTTNRIRSDTTQRLSIQDGELVVLEDELGQLDSTDPATLRDFISYCSQTAPADRNILVLWNHGGGPVYGYGYDQYQGADAALTLDEIQLALREAGVLFDFIGFDACLMGALETGCALYDYADYMVASEDFESARGWNYTGWLTALGEDPACPTEEVAQVLLDGYIGDCQAAEVDGVLSLVDLSCMKLLYQAWKDFAYANEETLTQANYSRETEGTDRSEAGEEARGLNRMTDYCVTDLMGVAATIESPESEALSLALRCALAAYAVTEEDKAMTGLSVTLPYGDQDFYDDMVEVFRACGFEEEYLSFLSAFVTAEGSEEFYEDWDRIDGDWSLWPDYLNGWTEEEWTNWIAGFSDDWDNEFGWENYTWLEETGVYISQGPADLSGLDAQVNGNEEWRYDEERNLYYYEFPDGIEFYDPVLESIFFHEITETTDEWYLWRIDRRDWYHCTGMCS